MLGIAEYLKKFANFTTPAQSAKRAVAKAVNEKFLTSLSEEDVTMRDGGAFVKASGVLKSEIALNKENLLSEVKKFLGTDAVRDLR